MAKTEKTLEQLYEELQEANKAYELAKQLDERKKKEEAAKKKAELAAVKEERKQEVKEAEKHYRDLLRQYIKDYGSYEGSYSYEDGDDCFSLLFGSHPFKIFM